MSQLKYTRLSYEDRLVVGNRHAGGESVAEIAIAIGVNKSTIYRELKRNGKPNTNQTRRVNKPREANLNSRHYRGTAKVDHIRAAKERHRSRLRKHNAGQASYDPKIADRLARERLKTAHAKQSKLLRPEYGATLKHVEERLRVRSSPRQIELSFRFNSLLGISENSIYRYINRYRPDLRRCLRRRAKPRRRPVVEGWNTAKDRRSIHSRPLVVESLERYGDLEGDTIFGKDTKDRLLTHVDRLTGLGSISLVLGYNASTVAKQTKQDLVRIFGVSVHTVTYDNGSEFSTWKQLEKDTGASIYFADPYKSQQRGRNENFNGLVRDFFPKGTDFKKLHAKDILRVESILNNRERERFNGLTPIEMSKFVALGVED